MFAVQAHEQCRLARRERRHLLAHVLQQLVLLGPRCERIVLARALLQLGIQHHLENRLTESAAAFEKSATLGGGCGVGMLMWGLAQRHGWGCEKNEQAGFRWLRRAAELAARMGVRNVSLSMSHDAGVALAVVIFEGD